MSQRGKAPIFFLFFLIIISLALAAGVYYLLQQEKAKSQGLQRDLDDIKIKQRMTLTELEASKKSIISLEARLRDNDAQIQKLTGDLEEEQAAKEEVLSQVAQLKSDLEDQKQKRQALENNFNLAQEEVGRLKVQLKELQVKRSELETQVKDLQEKSLGNEDIELGKIMVNPEAVAAQEDSAAASAAAREKAPPSSISGPEGKVLTVKKEYDFAILNLGSKDGLAVGNVFAIYHGNKYLGDVKVEKLHDSMSAAAFDPANNELKNGISIGDRAVLKAK